MSLSIDSMIRRHRPGFSLGQPFYTDPDVFETDLERVIGRQWLLVDHVSRIPNPGDYFLYRIGRDEIILVQDLEGEIRAFFNVCRHRGSRICRREEGNACLLTCPYHAWAYNLDGTLRSARLMPDSFEPDEYGLHACHLGIAEGLIFINLAEHPSDFETLVGPLREIMAFHGLADARVAHRGTYPTKANWKLVIENFF